MRTALFTHFRRIDKHLDQHLSLLVPLLILVILRLPNFFEPVWYGDEAIYLTLGNALRHGERLYAEIIDHKTPLIYYLAMVPTQVWFRVLNLGAMLSATTCLWMLAKQWLRRPAVVGAAVTGFVMATTLPTFEGNIPNGELFVMFFVLLGAVILNHTPLWQQVFHHSDALPGQQKKDVTPRAYLQLFLAGTLFSMGILTKVPALFDAAAFGSVWWFGLLLRTRDLTRDMHTGWATTRRHWQPFFLSLCTWGAGVVLPIALSVAYFILRGSGKAYLDYGLLYNFRYADSWHLDVPAVVAPFFSLPGKALLLALWLGVLTLAQRTLSRTFVFVSAWFGLATFATFLSNRPYPHYFLQVAPPLFLLIGMLAEEVWSLWQNARSQRQSNASTRGTQLLLQTAVGLGGVALLGAGMIGVRVYAYPTVAYYQRFLRAATGQITWQTYAEQFDPLVADNTTATQIMRTDDQPYLFIWGTNPLLYAQSGKVPTGRFTVLFHIKDFKAEQESLASVIAKKPTYVVVMKNADPYPELATYLYREYMPNANFHHFILWKKLAVVR